MHKSRSVKTMLLTVISIISLTSDALGIEFETTQVIQIHTSTEIDVQLFAVNNTTSWDARDSTQTRFDLPVLYLHQDRAITGDAGRTLHIEITGFAGGEEIAFEIVSRHDDISTGTPYTETQHATLPDRHCTSENPCVVRWTFNPHTTPSDFFTLRVRDIEGYILWENPFVDRPDFVMLDSWNVSLDDYTIRIIYATLFPFARGQIDLANRLTSAAVTDFVEQQFVPIIAETWNTQVTVWGLGKPMHPAWDADNIMEIIVTDAPFALFDNLGTRSRFIEDGQPTSECRLWWASSNNSFQAYKSLEEATKAVYAHEFFHLVQRNILLHTEYPSRRWKNVFIEAQGKFAPSVQYPDMEIRWPRVRPIELSEYLVAANRFLSLRLNSSYQNLADDPIHKYDMALYWRFLYEQYADIDIIQTALIEMTRGYQKGIVSAIKWVMDQTFAQHVGPFKAFEDSLIAFARANYALRLQDGRCDEEDFTKCGGYYYDPSGLYAIPPLEAELTYESTPISYEGAIPSSFGMDFIEININSTDHIEVTLEGEGNVAQYHIQVWPIVKAIPHDYALTADPVDIPQRENGVYSYVLDTIYEAQDLKLALIITRLDTRELIDANGLYTVTVDEANR